MRRRDVLRLAMMAAAAPLPALAQPSSRTFRIAVFGNVEQNTIMGPARQACVAELARLGFREGENLTVLYQSMTTSDAVLAARTKEFVDSKVDALVALGTELALKTVVSSSRTIPIVFVANNFDPIALGYVSSLAKPGGNITGIFLRATELAEKQVELLVEAFPERRRLAILWDAVSAGQFASADTLAKRLGLQVQSLKMENPPYELDAAFRSAAEAGSQMLLALTSPFFGVQGARLVELTTHHRLPTMFIFKPYTLGGGLMSYGADNIAMYAQSAGMVAKILRGVKPNDLPVELPTKFDFVVNLKTAKAIGVELPTSILLRANEVIE